MIKDSFEPVGLFSIRLYLELIPLYIHIQGTKMSFTRRYRVKTATQITSVSEVTVKPIKKRDIYEIVVKHMHGDANFYTTDDHLRDEEGMIRMVNFFLRCMAAYPNGMGGDDRFDHVQDYEEFENYLYRDNEYCNGHATPDTIIVYYYNADGVKCNVSFNTEEVPA